MDDPIICSCYSIKESYLREAIAKYSIKEIEGIMEICDAGTGCCSCHLLLESLIEKSENEDVGE